MLLLLLVLYSWDCEGSSSVSLATQVDFPQSLNWISSAQSHILVVDGVNWNFIGIYSLADRTIFKGFCTWKETAAIVYCDGLTPYVQEVLVFQGLLQTLVSFLLFLRILYDIWYFIVELWFLLWVVYRLSLRRGHVRALFNLGYLNRFPLILILNEIDLNSYGLSQRQRNYFLGRDSLPPIMIILIDNLLAISIAIIGVQFIKRLVRRHIHS